MKNTMNYFMIAVSVLMTAGLTSCEKEEILPAARTYKTPVAVTPIDFDLSQGSNGTSDSDEVKPFNISGGELTDHRRRRLHVKAINFDWTAFMDNEVVLPVPSDPTIPVDAEK